MRDGGIEALRGVEGALPGFAFDDAVQCNSYARFPKTGDDTPFVDPTDQCDCRRSRPPPLGCRILRVAGLRGGTSACIAAG